jgi:hypothetical protein
MNYYDRPEVKAQRLQAAIWNRESLDKMKERYPGQKCTIKRKENGTVEIYFNHKHKVSFMCLADKKDIIAWNTKGNVYIDRLKETNNLIRRSTQMATTKKVVKKEAKKTVEKQMKEIKEDVNSLITKLNKESDRNSSTARSLRKKIRSLGVYLSKNKAASEKKVEKKKAVKKEVKKVEKKKAVKKEVKE